MASFLKYAYVMIPFYDQDRTEDARTAIGLSRRWVKDNGKELLVPPPDPEHGPGYFYDPDDTNRFRMVPRYLERLDEMISAPRPGDPSAGTLYAANCLRTTSA